MAGWECRARLTGGTVAGLAAAPDADGRMLLFAATSVGIFRSANVGRDWASAGPSRAVDFAVSLAVSSSFARNSTLFAGTRDGLHRSLDGGQSWQHLLDSSRALALALAPGSAGADALLVGTEADGVLLSENAGRNWTSANPGLFDLSVLALALSPSFARDRTGFAGLATGLYRTRNGGAAWRLLDLPIEEPAVQCLAVSPNFGQDRLVLAGTEANGLLRSDDGGTHWDSVAGLPPRGVTALAFAARGEAGRTVAAATDQGLALSHDGGLTWQTVGAELGPALCLAFVPDGVREALVVGLPEQGIARSLDGGQTWSLSNAGLSARLLASLTVWPTTDPEHTLLAADLQRGVLASTDGGTSWTESNQGLETPEIFGLVQASAERTEPRLYATTANGLYRARPGAAWLPVLRESAGEPIQTLAVGASAGAEPPLAALVAGQLRFSPDGGVNWGPPSEVPGRARAVALGLSPEFAQDRTVFIGTSGRRSDGGAELILWRSTDAGQRWDRWLVEPGSDVLLLAVPPTYPRDGLLFVALGRRVLKPLRSAQELRAGQRRPIWLGLDLADEAERVTALAISPDYERDRTVFVATTSSVLVSRNAGERFERWNEGLSETPVVALAPSPDYRDDRLVYALGLGGSVWRRRDA